VRDALHATILWVLSSTVLLSAESVPEVLENAIGMKLVSIPAGEFDMGQASGESDEKPVHRVQITKPLFMGMHEVTNAQWNRVVGEIPSKWRDDSRPVEQVSWADAARFCQALSAMPEELKAERMYRLPTEAEWEYACRAGTPPQSAYGNNKSQLDDYGWYTANSGGATHPVGQKLANPWGLYDMHGNVAEWCSDWTGGKYAEGVVKDPVGPPNGHSRVARGGGYNDTKTDCRAADRAGFNPTATVAVVGFRVVMVPSNGRSPKTRKTK